MEGGKEGGREGGQGKRGGGEVEEGRMAEFESPKLGALPCSVGPEALELSHLLNWLNWTLT